MTKVMIIAMWAIFGLMALGVFCYIVHGCLDDLYYKCSEINNNLENVIYMLDRIYNAEWIVRPEESEDEED